MCCAVYCAKWSKSSFYLKWTIRQKVKRQLGIKISSWVLAVTENAYSLRPFYESKCVSNSITPFWFLWNISLKYNITNLPTFSNFQSSFSLSKYLFSPEPSTMDTSKLDSAFLLVSYQHILHICSSPEWASEKWAFPAIALQCLWNTFRINLKPSIWISS